AEQGAEPYGEQERRLEQNGGLGDRQISVDEAEEDTAEGVARVETDPCFPHGRLAADHRGDFAHPGLQRGVARSELRSPECVDDMKRSERKENHRAQGDQSSGNQHRTSALPGLYSTLFERPFLDRQLLFIRGEAHELAGPVVEHRREGVAGRAEIGHRVDVVADGGHFTLRRMARLALRVTIELSKADPSLFVEAVLEGLVRHRTVDEGPSHRLALKCVCAHWTTSTRTTVQWRCHSGWEVIRFQDRCRR